MPRNIVFFFTSSSHFLYNRSTEYSANKVICKKSTTGGTMSPPTMLVILDGFGYRKERSGNAIAHAKMPFLNALYSKNKSTLLKASGADVGLLPGYMGNSEVGHLTLGAGRIIPSPLKIVHDAIQDKSFFSNSILIHHFSELKKTQKALHIMGLLSNAGVHSHTDHLAACIRLASEQGLDKVFVHAFLDGRDTQPSSAKGYLKALDDIFHTLHCGALASIHGRFYAMDRDNNWQRTQTSYNVICALCPKYIEKRTWQEVVDESYRNAITDEFLVPQLLDPQGAIQDGDGIVFFNFRPDRALQLAESFLNPAFSHFRNPYNTGNKKVSFFITPMPLKQVFSEFKYDFLFRQEVVQHTLLDEISLQHQPAEPVFITAETEKYAHVTYFFRGMRDVQLPNEKRVLISSIKAKNYSARPEMSAAAITQSIIHSLRSSPAYFYLVNYANADMVGHSGNFQATIKACEVLDQQLALLYHEVIDRLNGVLIITADHGNAEEKIDGQGNILTAHTTNVVPFILVSNQTIRKKSKEAVLTKEPVFGLAHVAPTILKSMNLIIPSVMEQKTIF